MNIRQNEIQDYFNNEQEERTSLVTRNDAIGFNYQAKRSWFINYLRTINGNMLDIGCNNGNLAFLLRKQGVPPEQLNYMGIDIAKDSIKCAKHRNMPGAIFMVGSAHELTFSDESFDAVTLVEVIEHMQDQTQAIHEAARVLKPGGLLLLSTPNAECVPWLIDERLRFFVRRLFGLKNIDKDNPLTKSSLVRILTDAGLKMIEGPRYYWYRPYHIFKGRLFWPPHLAPKGLLYAMKHCTSIERNGNLKDNERRINCQSILVAARKMKR